MTTTAMKAVGGFEFISAAKYPELNETVLRPPTFSQDGSFMLCVNNKANIIVKALETPVLHTGWCVKVPKGYGLHVLMMQPYDVFNYTSFLPSQLSADYTSEIILKMPIKHQDYVIVSTMPVVKLIPFQLSKFHFSYSVTPDGYLHYLVNREILEAATSSDAPLDLSIRYAFTN